jgi:hypothetical protein
MNGSVARAEGRVASGEMGSSKGRDRAVAEMRAVKSGTWFV